MNNRLYILPFLAVLQFLSACSSKIVSNNYYNLNQDELLRIEEKYKRLNNQKPFTLSFTDKDFNIVSLEMITDTLTYIYEFNTRETNLADTLTKYGYATSGILDIMRRMQQIKCTWITSFDYYVNDRERNLVFISIKPRVIRQLFSPPKYLILAYFDQPQVFDNQGRLLDGRRTKRLRKLKGQVFTRITDRICYTVAEKYR
ncbi:MAG: hypothetical protein WAT19_06820 [Ferruginibacter sp.]